MSKKIISLVLGVALSLSTVSLVFANETKSVSPAKNTVVTENTKDTKSHAEKHALVFQSDFGVKDGAVCAMKGVSFGVDPELKIFDLTHEIPAYNIWEAAYRLQTTAKYWPEGTVFVSVVDPGVGTERKSVVLKTKTGHYFVTPDNGTLTLIAESMGIEELREIDEKVNRLKGSEESYTFHGRDVYAYTGARLASGSISFEEIGPKLESKVVSIPYQKAKEDNGIILGNVPILDIQYGNIWTNIDKETFNKIKPKTGEKFNIKIYNNDKLVYEGKMPYVYSFGYVEEGQPLLYINSVNNVSLALNMDSFAKVNNVQSGPDWKIEISKVK
ncbi:S-adenosyl-l-methionine hydroxide adenosyltransferase family protein [Clostridium aestuarii]|uniref:S-adenosyl-l-methionine hydroxide adenosyltransferase family protein n=1 Tax=Clostridium aestuarii TaxID=338193 RepID=A0ABT4D565_9CLOT|nr:S-adenosyl-l-methionine hydroxide adenosyltransferase family protein [Clostridium aestuarii]MCY6485782.1 S-adenosyl-l-methionine hydroxide adenosyltransferase family protein [Clostridium aestuarii]